MSQQLLNYLHYAWSTLEYHYLIWGKGIMITRHFGHVNSNVNFRIYIRYLQPPGTFLLYTIANSDYGLLFLVTI